MVCISEICVFVRRRLQFQQFVFLGSAPCATKANYAATHTEELLLDFNYNQVASIVLTQQYYI